MNAPIISVQHPTARVKPSKQFPRGWRDVHDAYLSRCDHPENVEYLLSVHESRWDTYWENAVVDRTVGKWGRFRVLMNRGRDCDVGQRNFLATEAGAETKLWTGTADDFYPPEHWDTLLLEALKQGGGSLDKPVLIHFSTGASPERDRELMIGCAATRKVFEHYGYILDPDFESMFADNWWTYCLKRDAAAGLLKIIERLDIRFDHRHPIFGKGEMDEVYALQNRREAYMRGSIVFHQKVTGASELIMCLPGESFRSEVVASRFQMIEQAKAAGYIIAPHWAYTSNVYATRYELTDHALRFPSITKEKDLILWIDDDNLLDWPQLATLIQDLAENPELSGVTGWCWCDHNEEDQDQSKRWVMSCGRQSQPDLACLRFSAEDFDRAIGRGDWLIGSDDLEPHAFWSGLPVVLMRRKALEELGPSAFAPVIRADVKYGFLSEDAAFFLRAHEQGLKFAVDIRVKVPHQKWRSIEPPYQVLQQAKREVGMSAAAD